MAAAWNRGKKWSEETKKRISEGTKRNHPMRGPNREELIEKITRWQREAKHRNDCRCCHCSEVTRRRMSAANRRRGRRNNNILKSKAQIV